MTKCYAVMQRNYNGMQETNLLAVFASEGEAEQSAESHSDTTHKAWVEEVNYYE